MSDGILFLHLLGAVIWAGGLIVLGIVAFGARRALAPEDRLALFRFVGRAFLVASGLAAAMLLISGSVMVGDLFGGWDDLGGTREGDLVIAKTALFATVLILAAIHALVLGPRLRRLRLETGERPSAGQGRSLTRLSIASGVTQVLMLAGTIAILVLAADLAAP